MRVLLLNQYYAPDEAATAQLLADLGEALARDGHDVVAVCGDRAYGDPDRRYASRETIGGVDVVRVRSSGFGRTRRFGRLLDYVTYFSGAAIRVLSRRRDVVVSLSTPPLLALLGVVAARLRGGSSSSMTLPASPGPHGPPSPASGEGSQTPTPLHMGERGGASSAGVRPDAPGAGGEVRPRAIFWSMDVYPELAFELGAIRRKSIAGRLLLWLSRVILNRSDRVVALGPTMATRLEEEALMTRASPGPAGPPSPPSGEGKMAPPLQMLERGPGGEANITFIHNWADGEAIRPRAIQGHPLRPEWGWDGRFVVLYSGNLGLAHDFETALSAAALLRAEPRVLFAFVGVGPMRDRLRREADDRRLENVEFRDAMPRSALPESLTAGDVHLVTLRQGIEGLLVPSKIYGILAAGRPTLYVGPEAGEVFEIVKSGSCGAAVKNGDFHRLTSEILAYAGDPARCRQEGENARDLFDREFSKAKALERWKRVIESPLPLRERSAR